MTRDDRGQATVEFALVLPLLLLVIVGGLQLVLVTRNQVLLVNSARAAARVAATTGDLAAISKSGREASPGLRSERLTFEVSGERVPEKLVTVRAIYRQPVRIPFAESLWREGVTLRVDVAMPVEVA